MAFRRSRAVLLEIQSGDTLWISAINDYMAFCTRYQVQNRCLATLKYSGKVVDVIRSNFEKLRRKKAFEENRSLPLRTIVDETGLSQATLIRIKAENPARFDARTLDTLCVYFGCGVGDLLEHIDTAVN